MLNTHHQGDMAKVAADIFAHYYTSGRNALAVKLIVSGRSFRAGNLCNRPLHHPLTSPHLPITPPLSSTSQNALQGEESYNMSEDLKLTLSQLASLSYHKNSKVALAARQVGGAYTVTMVISRLLSWQCC